jgi:hypothetical protein
VSEDEASLPSPSAAVAPEPPSSFPVVSRAGLAAILALPLHALLLWSLSAVPSWVEAVYGRGLYPLVVQVQALLDQTSLSPALTILVLLVLALAFSVRQRPKPIRRFAWRFLVSVAVVGHLFPLCWGLGYWRPSVPTRVGLDLTPPKRAELEATAGLVCQATNRARVEWSYPSRADLDRRVDRALRAFLTRVDLGEGLSRLQRPVRFIPAGSMLVGGWTGVCVPWTTESWVDPAVDDRVLPVSIAHEKAHQAGFARESDADLIAFLSLVHADDAELRYAALFDVASLFSHHTTTGLTVEVLADAGIVIEKVEAVVIPVVEKATQAVYDTYLKVNAVEPGIDDYVLVERLIHAWLAARPEEKRYLEQLAGN